MVENVIKKHEIPGPDLILIAEVPSGLILKYHSSNKSFNKIAPGRAEARNSKQIQMTKT